MKRFPVFWEWLLHNGNIGNVKVPQEQYEEVVVGNGDIVDWLKDEDVKSAMLLSEEAEPSIVANVIDIGYAPNLNESELLIVGRDPFLIAYGVADASNRCVVSFEVSAPSKQRANRKVPDVCAQFGVQCRTLFDVIDALDFSTDWTPP
jgi:hypothetical protein